MKTAKILVVDDKRIVLMGLMRIFEDEGYFVKIALGGKKAIEMASKEHFDIVYTDLKMPFVNGVAVCEEIKKMSPKTEVIVFSGSPDELEKLLVDFLSKGGKDMNLRKPVFSEEIIRITKQVLTAKSKNIE